MQESKFFLTGQEAWIRKLKWPGLKAFSQQRWKALYVSPESTDTAAFYKAHENFAFFWILKAGHMVNNIDIGGGREHHYQQENVSMCMFLLLSSLQQLLTVCFISVLGTI